MGCSAPLPGATRPNRHGPFRMPVPRNCRVGFALQESSTRGLVVVLWGPRVCPGRQPDRADDAGVERGWGARLPGRTYYFTRLMRGKMSSWSHERAGVSTQVGGAGDTLVGADSGRLALYLLTCSRDRLRGLISGRARDRSRVVAEEELTLSPRILGGRTDVNDIPGGGGIAFSIAMIGADRRRFRGGALPHRSFLLTRGLDATHSGDSLCCRPGISSSTGRPSASRSLRSCSPSGAGRLRNIPIRILQILPADTRLRPLRVLSVSSAAAFCASHGVLRVDRGRSDAIY